MIDALFLPTLSRPGQPPLLAHQPPTSPSHTGTCSEAGSTHVAAPCLPQVACLGAGTHGLLMGPTGAYIDNPRVVLFLAWR